MTVAAHAPAAARRTTALRVRYAETDQMRVVYHANYFVWFEVARTDWLRSSGRTYRMLEHDGVVLPVIEAHCKYLKPARYDDDIELHTTGVRLSAVRVRFDYVVVRPSDTVALATGHTIHAAVDREGRPCRLPGDVADLFRSTVPDDSDAAVRTRPQHHIERPNEKRAPE